MAISEPEPLSSQHDLSQFDCGTPALNTWLKTFATRNQSLGFTAVMVVHEAQRVVGYYGLAPSAIESARVPRSIRTGQPPHPMPVILLGQLAVDKDWAGRGIGNGLLKHALVRCAAVADLAGGRAVMVNAIDAAAAAYWLKHGFIPSKDNDGTLFRSMSDVRAVLAASGISMPKSRP